MVLLGTIVNGICIIVGTLIGSFLTNINEKYRGTITQGIALTAILIGIQMALQVQSVIIILLSILTGAIIGEMLDLEKGLNKLGSWIANRFAMKGNNTNIAQ